MKKYLEYSSVFKWPLNGPHFEKWTYDAKHQGINYLNLMESFYSVTNIAFAHTTKIDYF